MIIPKALRKNDLILVVSPAFAPDAEEFQAGISSLQRSGFRVETAPNCQKTHGSFAGTDEERLADLQWALDHPEARMILCSRGGYGSGRIFRELNLQGMHANPKWLVGFSDVTVLHFLLQEAGFASIHGPMLVHYSRLMQLPACIRQQDLMMNGFQLKYEISFHSEADSSIYTDNLSAILTGGNLSLLEYLLPEIPEEFFDGRFLFLEEVGEPYYKIDRMLDRLFRSGKLQGVKGFILGSFSECATDKFPKTPADMIRERCGTEIPVFEGLPCGHAQPSMPLVLGYHTRITPSGAKWVLSQDSLPLILVAD
jgi:muramoyltetrapeptide carboxypeptidase